MVYCFRKLNTREVNKMVVTKETIIGAVLDFDPNAARIFHMNGMFCTGCPHSRSESIGDACLVHGIDADELVKSLNDYFQSK